MRVMGGARGGARGGRSTKRAPVTTYTSLDGSQAPWEDGSQLPDSELDSGENRRRSSSLCEPGSVAGWHDYVGVFRDPFHRDFVIVAAANPRSCHCVLSYRLEAVHIFVF